jgi:WD40 repeat protein
LYSGSCDETIKVWDITSKKCIATLKGHDDVVSCLCLSHQRHRLFSGGGHHDKKIRIWDTQTLKCIHIVKADIRDLILDESANRLYSAGGWNDRVIKIWDWSKFDTLTCIRRLEEDEVWAFFVRLSPTPNTLYAGTGDGYINVWNTASSECVSTKESHSGWISSLCLSEDGSRLYSGSVDHTIKAWDTATNTCMATLQGHTGHVTSLCLSFKTNRLISASADKTIRVWDTTNYACIHTVTDAHLAPIKNLLLSDNSDTLYSAGSDGFLPPECKSDCTIKAWQIRHTFA